MTILRSTKKGCSHHAVALTVFHSVHYVCLTQSQSTYFLRSLANKNVGRQSMLLKGVWLNELSEGELDVVLSFLADTSLSAAWFHPDALFICLAGGFSRVMFLMAKSKDTDILTNVSKDAGLKKREKCMKTLKSQFNL